ncbi:uncharacterized protein LOC109728520 [Ananas comosus]|uniref:Uncharacterized protein LOC109728520 n=1 Tax=Ananas comosus TaxID=4615 RepID=A0A6P5H0Q6_ANACO|nr:uncharacterized protein LOC109728520 [Ananas comosus]
MLLHGGGGGSDGGAAAAVAMARMLVRCFSRKRGQDVRRINPKVLREEASEIPKGLYQIRQGSRASHCRQHLELRQCSKKWRLGYYSSLPFSSPLQWRCKMLKLSCTHIGSSKKFVCSTLPEDPKAAQPTTPLPVTETVKISVQGKKERRPKPSPPKKGVLPCKVSETRHLYIRICTMKEKEKTPFDPLKRRSIEYKSSSLFAPIEWRIITYLLFLDEAQLVFEPSEAAANG